MKIRFKAFFIGIAFRGLLDLLDLLERRDLLEDQDQWDPLEPVESAEKLDQRSASISFPAYFSVISLV